MNYLFNIYVFDIFPFRYFSLSTFFLSTFFFSTFFPSFFSTFFLFDIFPFDISTATQFYFSASELLKESQVQSYFCRLKRDREVTGTRQVPTDNPIVKDNALKNSSNDNDDEDVDSELEVLEQDFQDTEIAVEDVEILENFNINAKMALELSLSMNS